MATIKQVLSTIKQLTAYYAREPSDKQVEIYVELLGGLEAWRLQDAAIDWMRKSPFFPKVCELQELAQAYPEPPPDYLAAEASLIADKFYFTGELDQAEWEALIERFERADRPYRAANLRKRYATYTAMRAQQDNDKEDQQEPASDAAEEDADNLVPND